MGTNEIVAIMVLLQVLTGAGISVITLIFNRGKTAATAQKMQAEAFAQITASVTTLVGEITNLSKIINERDAKIDKLETESRKQAVERGKMLQRITDLEKVNKVSSGRVSDLEITVRELTKQNTEKDRLIATLNSKISALETERDTRDASIEKLQSRIVELETARSNDAQKLADMEAERAKLAEKAEALAAVASFENDNKTGFSYSQDTEKASIAQNDKNITGDADG